MPPAKKVKRRKYSEDPKVDLELRIAHALNHPVRAEILAIVNQEPAAPSEVKSSGQFPDRDLSNLAYHFRVLHELGMIEPIRSEKGDRGGDKTVYRGCARMFLSDIDWAELSPGAKSGLTMFSVKAIFERTQAALAANTMDSKPDRHLSTTTLPVDVEGWDEMKAVLRHALDRIIEIEATSAERTKNASERFKVTVNLMGFESP